MRSPKHVLDGKGVCRSKAVRLPRRQHVKLAQRENGLPHRVGGGALVDSERRRKRVLAPGEHARHGLVGHEHGFLDKRRCPRSAPHGDAHGASVLV